MKSMRFLLIVLVTLWSNAGCGSKQDADRLQVFPTRGKVLYQGQPAVGALIRLHPRGTLGKPLAFQPRARVGRDGSFELTTYDNHDGAPAGDYAVTIVWRQLLDGDETMEGPSYIPAEYNQPDTTPVQVQVQPIESGNELPPIELAP